MAATGALAARPLAAPARRAPAAAAQRGGGKKRGGAAKRVSYGDSWFDATNGAAAKTVAQQIGRRVVEDRKAGRVDRADLYTDNWDGSEYKGSKWNFATLLGVLFIATPLAGLAFAYFSYGVLWG